MNHFPLIIAATVEEKTLCCTFKMRVQYSQVQIAPREKYETTLLTNTKDSSNNNALHEHHQRTYDVPSAKTDSHLSRCAWLGQTMGRQETIPIIATEKLHPSVNALWHLIEDNCEVRSLFTQMLQQIPNGPLYDRNPTGSPQFRNWMGLLCAFNNQLTQGPVWLYDTPGQQGLIGFPFNALLVRYRNLTSPTFCGFSPVANRISNPAQTQKNWSMSTPAGLLTFHRPDVNARLRDILTAYGNFLSSPASAAVLNSSATGWLSPTAFDALVSTACLPSTINTNSSDREAKTDTSDDPRPQFHDLFVSDPLHHTYGFSSWDAFFTRRFRPGIRPVANPSGDGVIVNACESTPVALERGVKLHDEFWVKGQPYSLVTILGALQTNEEGEESGDNLDMKRDEEQKKKKAKDKELEQSLRFEGGTIYQGFLGALSYHRWHAPVSGVVEKVKKIQGTYFAGCPGLASREDLQDGEERELDPSAPDESQRYLCQVGTRAVVYIRARDRRLKTVVFVAVGMAEVSSCEITVKEGDMVEKGEEIGMVSFRSSLLPKSRVFMLTWVLMMSDCLI